MPISFRVDRARRLRYATATGVITDADLLTILGAVLDDPDYDASLDQLFDGSGIEGLDVSTEAVREIAQRLGVADRAIPEGVRPKTAIVAPTDAAFGLARMYQTYRGLEAPRKDYLVCRTIEEARAWLGLSDR